MQTVLTQSLYQGTHYSASLPWPAGNTTVQATGLLSEQDASNPASACTFGIEVSFDGGKTFQLGAAGQYAGGTDPRTNGPLYPNVGVGYSSNQPTHARVRVDIPNPLSIGATLAFSA